MTEQAPWYPYEAGRSIGTRGSEDGLIVRDEEHSDGARITLERDGRIAPWTITCGVYGWMFHTRFFPNEISATTAFEAMKEGLDEVLRSLPGRSESDEDRLRIAGEAIEAFVERFP